ncbi:MAG: hypothetical protein HY051_03605 [Candidatus Aenigmarchaeota archaeon]|nr:hypothetical protein [Candidatus Aenigmarchaeota archaeon]
MKNLLFLLFIVLFSQSGLAHLGGGEDRVVGGYLVEFGYAPGTPVQNEETFIALSLANNTTLQPIDVEKVLIRISDPDKLVFAGSFLPENRNVGFTYVFQAGGEHEIEAAFYKNDVILTSTKFKLAVEGMINPFILAGAAIAAIFLYLRFRSK